MKIAIQILNYIDLYFKNNDLSLFYTYKKIIICYIYYDSSIFVFREELKVVFLF